MLLEIKLDKSFPEGQVVIEGYGKPYKIDRKRHGGGKIQFIRDHIPSKLLHIGKLVIEDIYVEINLEKKWLLFALIS